MQQPITDPNPAFLHPRLPGRTRVLHGRSVENFSGANHFSNLPSFTSDPYQRPEDTSPSSGILAFDSITLALPLKLRVKLLFAFIVFGISLAGLILGRKYSSVPVFVVSVVGAMMTLISSLVLAWTEWMKRHDPASPTQISRRSDSMDSDLESQDVSESDEVMEIEMEMEGFESLVENSGSDPSNNIDIANDDPRFRPVTVISFDILFVAGPTKLCL
ncbi:hypothetical protein GYMLUDRAFT_257697 [Collybiopsis luxurians FD-317 M1]|nr:hypothetical protein GYMLUDRAFT_257697 [Collybiopsis luxurians FD-317 M1]